MMEVVPHAHYELAKPEVFVEIDLNRSEILALTAVAAVATVVLIPVALGKGYGSRITSIVNESPRVEKARAFIANEVDMLAHVFASGKRGSPGLKR